jgi:hypothetical protein
VAACSSVPAYSSSIFSGPSQSIQACLSHGGHGAATWKATFREETSAPSRTASGRRQMRSIMVGTRYRQLAWCFSIRPSVWAGSNLDMSTTWSPSSIATAVATNGALWGQRPCHDGALAGRQAHQRGEASHVLKQGR